MRTHRLVLLLWLCIPAPAMADVVAETVIKAIDIRLTPETVSKAGITIELAQDLATDPEQTPYVRARAVSALAALGGEQARQMIEVVAIMDPVPAVRSQAIVSLARAFGPWDRARVTAFLVEQLPWNEGAIERRIQRELRRLAQGPQ